MSTDYQNSKSAQLAETGLNMASQIAWVTPGIEPLGAVLGIIATIVGESVPYDDGQPTNQDLKDALDALKLQIETQSLMTSRVAISNLRNLVLVTDIELMQKYNESPADYFANNGVNGGESILKPADDLKSAILDAKTDTVVIALGDLSDAATPKALAISNLGLYILGRSYFHTKLVHFLEICKAVYTYPGNTHTQHKPVPTDQIRHWNDTNHDLMTALQDSLTAGLDYAEPLLVKLKQAFLERPRKAREQTQNLPNKLQALGIAFRQFTIDNFLDKITELEVDTHLQTMHEWRKTLALKCRAAYDADDATKKEPAFVTPALQFLFEADASGGFVNDLDNTRLVDGKLAVQYAGINSGALGGAGEYGYYQIDAKLNPAVTSTLTAAGQLDQVNQLLRDGYDGVYGDGHWQEDYNFQLAIQHYPTCTSLLVELAPSVGHIGSDVQGLVYSLGPSSDQMKIMPAGDGTTLGGHFETDSQGHRTQVGGTFYQAGWVGLADNYQQLYYDALQGLGEWNEAAADPDNSAMKPFAAFRIKLLASDPVYADSAVLAEAYERILHGLLNGATDFPEAADIVILVGAESGRVALTAAAIKAFKAEVNMRGFQLSIPPKS